LTANPGFGRELSRTAHQEKIEIRNKHESQNTNPKRPSEEFSSPARVIGSFGFRALPGHVGARFGGPC
jgi:hypothetical protein